MKKSIVVKSFKFPINVGLPIGKLLIRKLGIEQDRIEIHQISASEGKIFADKISQFTENVKKLGKSKLNKKKEPLGVLI